MAVSKKKVYLDASVIYAAVLNPFGGSGEILNQGKKGKIRLISNLDAIREVKEALGKKKPEKITELPKILQQAKVKTVPTSRFYLAFCWKLIHPKDIHILSTALAVRADFLITLDQKHFMTPKIKKARLPIKILAPKDFLEKFFIKRD